MNTLNLTGELSQSLDGFEEGDVVVVTVTARVASRTEDTVSLDVEDASVKATETFSDAAHQAKVALRIEPTIG